MTAETDRIDRIIGYARERFTRQVDGILDDPSGWTIDEWRGIERLAVDLQVPLHELLQRGTPFEQKRVREKFGTTAV